MVNEERAVELLAQIPASDAVTKIRLSNKSFSEGAASIIAERLSSFTSLEIADISDIIAGRPEDEALRVLTIICNSIRTCPLKEVNVSDNALGAKGVNACRSILTDKKLEHVYFCNNGLSAEACELITTIFAEGGYPQLRTLHFYNNMSGNAGAVAVSAMLPHLTSLQDFRYSSTRCQAEGNEALMQALKEHTSLLRLDLSDSSFSDDAAEALAALLKKQANLEYLNLRDGSLEEERGSAVLKALEHTPKLAHLDLSANDFAEEQFSLLASLLPKLSDLQELHLDDTCLSLDDVRVLVSGLKSCTKLRLLSLQGCEITAAGAVLLARCVSSLPAFVQLNLDNNCIVENGIDVLQSILSRAGKLLGSLEENDEDGDDDLEEVLGEDEEDQDECEELTEAAKKLEI